MQQAISNKKLQIRFDRCNLSDRLSTLCSFVYQLGKIRRIRLIFLRVSLRNLIATSLRFWFTEPNATLTLQIVPIFRWSGARVATIFIGINGKVIVQSSLVIIEGIVANRRQSKCQFYNDTIEINQKCAKIPETIAIATVPVVSVEIITVAVTVVVVAPVIKITATTEIIITNI